MLPTTDPDAPAERTVSSARKCQLAPVVALVWVQIVVEPSLRAKVMAGPFRPGSVLEPKASMLMAARVAREPAERAVVPSNRLLAPLVDQAVTRPGINGERAGGGEGPGEGEGGAMERVAAAVGGRGGGGAGLASHGGGGLPRNPRPRHRLV